MHRVHPSRGREVAIRQIRPVGSTADLRTRPGECAAFDQTTGELSTRRVIGRPHELVDRLLDVSRPARMVYEAGATGYWLVRRARALGIEMAVLRGGAHRASPGDRVKTDQRRLALRMLRATTTFDAGVSGRCCRAVV